jgi:hypothetical protein
MSFASTINPKVIVKIEKEVIFGLILLVFGNSQSILISLNFPGIGDNFPGITYWQFPGNFPVGKMPGKITNYKCLYVVLCYFNS